MEVMKLDISVFNLFLSHIFPNVMVRPPVHTGSSASSSPIRRCRLLWTWKRV